ncbi:MAG: hypothetical protein J5601_06660 [Elusimicrobiaceae bacterium]|nr:hypothetical protein [Elusimicrobiaceae bacterium]
MTLRNWLFGVIILAGSTIGFAQTAAPVQQPQEKATDASKPVAAAPVEQMPAATTGVATEGEGFVAPREEVTQTAQQPSKEPKVVFNPKNKKDPTLSPDDILLLEYRERERLRALEAERERKLAEERRRKAEAERLRQLELERARDPSREIRNKINVSGVIGKEVFIGSKVYTIGDRVLGARIEEVHPEYVVFSYKGQRFRRNVKL